MFFPRDANSPAQIMGTVSSFWPVRALLSAYELDLFSAVGTGNATAAGVAAAAGTDPRATDRLLNALCALGLLDKKNGRFSNTPLAGKFLDKQSPRYLRGLGHAVHLWDGWSTLTTAVKTGSAALPPAVAGGDEKWLAAFIAAMDERARAGAPEMIKFIDLTGVRRTLDIGGGSGAFSIALAKASPEISATVFDLPAVLALTAGYVDRAGLTGRIHLLPGDYNNDPFGSGFDLVLLSAILHSNSPEENKILLAKAVRALSPGGQIVVSDFFMTEDRCAPPFAALFALNMLVATRAGDTYTETEVRDWLAAAGISEIARHDPPYGAPLLIGRKP